MIKSFRDRRTRELFEVGASSGVPQALAWRAVRRLDRLDEIQAVGELRQPRSFRLHALRADRAGQFAIAVNRQWRVCFRFEGGHAYDVEFCDYH